MATLSRALHAQCAGLRAKDAGDGCRRRHPPGLHPAGPRDGGAQVWRHVADQLRPRFEKLGRLMDEAEHDVLAYMTFAAQHRTKLHSTDPLRRLKMRKVKRRADVVGIFE